MRERGEQAVRHGATSLRRYSLRQKALAWLLIVAILAGLVGLIVLFLSWGASA
jgi:hypothetical protein